jgi:glycosyltransferase involved in cell wall biosynthesis
MGSRVSVIIPAFNASKTIERALLSVLAQTRPADEIIVVDDGSSDDTLTVLEQYRSQIVLRSQPNAGASAARNHAARIATGDVIAFLDSDDVWHPRKIEIQLAALENEPDFAVSWTDSISIAEAGFSAFDMNTLAVQTPPRIRIIDNFNEIFLNPYFGTPNVMMRRAHFARCGGFDESLSTAEDVDLWIRACYGRGVVRVDELLCVVVKQVGSLSSRIKDSVYNNHLRVIESFCAAHPEYLQQSSSTIRRAKAHIYELWGSNALCQREHVAARHALTQAIKLSPSWRSTYLLAKSLLWTITSSTNSKPKDK